MFYLVMLLNLWLISAPWAYSNLKDSYGGLNTCKDCFTYTISISVDNKTKTITTTDGAPNTPAELGKILTLINDFINKIPE